MKNFYCLAITLFFLSCSSNTQQDTSAEREPLPDGQEVSGATTSVAGKDPYEVMEVAFEGYPSKEKIQPMLEDVMKRYDMPITDDNLLKAANVLVTLKNDSKVGVTEMDILKHVYQHGSASGDYVTNAAISATYLEQTK